MSEMVERVARALEERAKASPYEFVPQDGPCAGAFGLNFSAFARAAIEAMREPTEAQYDALSNTGLTWRELNSTLVWKTYIDAALKP